MPGTNNVTRMLDAKKIPYTAFELPEEKLGALETARLLKIPPEQVFKSIVALRSAPGAKPILAVIPATCQLDVKALASLVREKKIKVPTQREAEQLTGLRAGGISPLALINHGIQFFLHSSAKNLGEINVSGGQLGLNIRLGVNDLIKLTGAKLAEIGIVSENADREG